MYNIGYCKICKQGLLEIVKDKLTQTSHRKNGLAP